MEQKHHFPPTNIYTESHPLKIEFIGKKVENTATKVTGLVVGNVERFMEQRTLFPPTVMFTKSHL